MLLELLRPLSFFLALLSLYPVLMSAFFIPGTHWEERLWLALLRVTFAACCCFLSGFLYSLPTPGSTPSPAPFPTSNPSPIAAHATAEPLLSTLPVRLFFWAIGAMALLFAVSWWIDVYFLPLTRPDYFRR